MLSGYQIQMLLKQHITHSCYSLATRVQNVVEI